jgi:hypothetical protein
MYIAAKSHVSDQTAPKIGADISGRRADYKKIDIRDVALRRLQACGYRLAAGFEGAAQVTPVQVTGRLFANGARRNVKVPEIDIAVAKDLEDARAGIAGHLKGLVLAEAARRVRQADSFDYRSHGCEGLHYAKDLDDCGFIPIRGETQSVEATPNEPLAETGAMSNAARLQKAHRRPGR